MKNTTTKKLKNRINQLEASEIGLKNQLTYSQDKHGKCLEEIRLLENAKAVLVGERNKAFTDFTETTSRLNHLQMRYESVIATSQDLVKTNAHLMQFVPKKH